jgi:hypothetical protein
MRLQDKLGNEIFARKSTNVPPSVIDAVLGDVHLNMTRQGDGRPMTFPAFKHKVMSKPPPTKEPPFSAAWEEIMNNTKVGPEFFEGELADLVAQARGIKDLQRGRTPAEDYPRSHAPVPAAGSKSEDDSGSESETESETETEEEWRSKPRAAKRPRTSGQQTGAMNPVWAITQMWCHRVIKEFGLEACTGGWPEETNYIPCVDANDVFRDLQKKTLPGVPKLAATDYGSRNNFRTNFKACGFVSTVDKGISYYVVPSRFGGPVQFLDRMKESGFYVEALETHYEMYFDLES